MNNSTSMGPQHFALFQSRESVQERLLQPLRQPCRKALGSENPQHTDCACSTNAAAVVAFEEGRRTQTFLEIVDATPWDPQSPLASEALERSQRVVARFPIITILFTLGIAGFLG
ncbi:hypothetical protein BSKO_12100 [Bryopsis sp. KO-2023]|nr:hypothetical protein BSKO_12100 [Bryopsis sp. KO-2023]